MKKFLQTNMLYVLVILYLFTRLAFLTHLPIFTDESIYIYWAKLIETTRSQWFISLSDGKPPLLIWMAAAFLNILPQKSYLLAGRLPSVIAGLFSLIAMWQIAGILFNSKKAQAVGGFLYVINPFLLLYDRMALFDSLLCAALLWSVYFSLRTAKTLRWLDGILWGISLGVALLSKPTAMLYVFLIIPIVFLFSTIQHKKLPLQKLTLLSIGAVIISELINNVQRFSHVYAMAAIKNSQFQQPISELIKNPFHLTFGNMHGFFSWIIGYYTIPFFILVLISFVFLFVKKWKIGFILFSLWFLPIFALATVGREIFPRYILFTTPYAILSVTFLISTIWERKKKIERYFALCLGVLCLPLVITSYLIIFVPEKAPLPRTDASQYITEHASGYGLKKVFDFLDKKSMNQHITVVTQGTFGLYPYAFNLEYWNDPHVTILPRWPLSTLDQDIFSAQKSGDVYLIFKEQSGVPAGMPVLEVLRADKPGGGFPIIITKLLPQ